MIEIKYMPGVLGWVVYEWRGGANGYKEFKDVKGDWKPVKPGTSVEPTLYIEDLMEWAEAIRKAGVKLPEDHHLEGVLEAQSHHLEDMRAIAFSRVVGAKRPTHSNQPKTSSRGIRKEL